MAVMPSVKEHPATTGRSLRNVRRIVTALGAGCLAIAAGLAVWQVAQAFHLAARHRAAAAPASEEGVVFREGPLGISSKRQSAEGDLTFFDGDVRITLPDCTIRCQHVQLEAVADGRIRLAGYGGVTIARFAGLRDIRADQFTFDSAAGGRLTLAGEVCLDAAEGRRKFRLCTIAGDGQIIRGRSLLDDLAESTTAERKLALIDAIAAFYTDDELPPEAGWWLALKLLDRRLKWTKETKGRFLAAPGEPPQPTATAPLDPELWPEAHEGEPWMRPAGGRRTFWRLVERRHVDVQRAVDLLRRPGRDAADDASRRRWLAEIGRNNTLVRLVVERTYSPGAAAVTIDVRNADQLTVQVFRVGHGAAWEAVCRRLGRDFTFADGQVPFSVSQATADIGPQKLGYLIENQVAAWTVYVDALGPNKASAAKRPAPGPGSSWRGNRELVVPARALEAPGFYVVAVEANGETAYAPLRVGNDP